MPTSNEHGARHMPGPSLVDRVRESATAQLSTQKDRATESLGTIARAVRDTSQPLRTHQQDTIAQYVEQAADQIDRFSARLRDRDVTELIDDAQQFARRQPALFVGAAFAAGVIAARFLKSSSDNMTTSHRATSSLRDRAYEYPTRRAATTYGVGPEETRDARGGL
jgi:hypothetical protein